MGAAECTLKNLLLREDGRRTKRLILESGPIPRRGVVTNCLWIHRVPTQISVQEEIASLKISASLKVECACHKLSFSLIPQCDPVGSLFDNIGEKRKSLFVAFPVVRRHVVFLGCTGPDSRLAEEFGFLRAVPPPPNICAPDRPRFPLQTTQPTPWLVFRRKATNPPKDFTSEGNCFPSCAETMMISAATASLAAISSFSFGFPQARRRISTSDWRKDTVLRVARPYSRRFSSRVCQSPNPFAQ